MKERPARTPEGSVCYTAYDGEYRKWDGKQWVFCKNPYRIIERPWPFSDLGIECLYREEWETFG
jgi:hypothetical protein